MARITQKQINQLKHAVEMAEDWRGNMVGAASSDAIAEFDNFIADCKKALTVVRAMRKETAQRKGICW